MSAEGAAQRKKYSWHFYMHLHLIIMAGKYLSVYLHSIWSTKSRRGAIDEQWRHRLHAYMGAIARKKNARLLEAQSQADHIHLCLSMPSTISIADLVGTLKANSTRWIHETFPNRRLFAWQEGYAAFSVGKSDEKAIIEYIRNQDMHHKQHDFCQEFIDLMNQHQIEYDIRYVFD
jgi:putative transposase